MSPDTSDPCCLARGMFVADHPCLTGVEPRAPDAGRSDTSRTAPENRKAPTGLTSASVSVTRCAESSHAMLYMADRYGVDVRMAREELVAWDEADPP